MASPLTDRSGALAPADGDPGGTADAVVAAVAEIAGAAGRLVSRAVARRATGSPTSPTGRASRAWRSPPSTGRTPPGRALRPDQEVVSVAWSPGRRHGWPTWSAPAARSARSCTPSGPTVPASGCSPVRTRAPPCSPGAGPAPGTTSAPSPRATARTPTSSWWTRLTGAPARPGRRGLPVGHRGVGRRPVRAGPPRSAGLPAHRLADVATGEQRRVLPAGRPRGPRVRGRPLRTGRRLGLRAGLAARGARRRPRRSGRGPALRPAATGRGPGRARTARTPTSTATPCVPTAPCSRSGPSDGVTELCVHALSDGALSPAVALPEPVMPGWSLPADGTTMVAELTGPARPAGPVGRPGRRAAAPRAAAVGLPRPSVTPPSGAAGALRVLGPGRAAAVGLAVHAGRRAAGPTARSSASTGARRGRSGRGSRRSPRAWSPPGFTVFAPNVRGLRRVRPGVHDRRRRPGPRGVLRRRPDDGRRTRRRRDRRAGPGRGARLVLRRLPHAGRADPLAGPVRRGRHRRRHERPADLLRRAPSRGWPRRRSPSTATRSPTARCSPRSSPMTSLDRPTSPVLFAHGDRDTNVPGRRVRAGAPGAAGSAGRAATCCSCPVRATPSWAATTSSS